MSTDYTGLIPSENNGQPNFVATVALLANGVADITALLQSFPTLFNLNTAVGQQLDIIGQWVGITRVIAGVLSPGFFGFADDVSALGFGELTDASIGGRFIELTDAASGSTILGDPEYRLLLKAKIAENNWSGDIAELEAAVADLIPIPVATIDPGALVVAFLPSGNIDPTVAALITGYDILPRAAGVRYQFMLPLGTLSWTTAGTASASGNAVSKPSGTTAWDSAAWLALPSAHAYVGWTSPDTTHYVMGGLAANPSGSPNYPTLNFGLDTQPGGAIVIYESGTSQGTFGSYAAGDSFAVYYDGRQAIYLHNGVVIHTTIAAPGSLAPMFCLYSPGGQAQNIAIYTG